MIYEKLTYIINNDIVRKNVFEQLNYVSELYEIINKKSVNEQAIYVYNYMISLGALIETTIDSAIKKLTHFIHLINGNNDFKFRMITNFQDLIDLAIEVKLLNIDSIFLHDLRHIRNNIHLHRMRQLIIENNDYNIEVLKKRNQLFTKIVVNLYENLKQLEYDLKDTLNRR